MTYKETLFFIGKCLTITHEEHNKTIVENLLQNNNVDWDNVVKVSTSHYVFPALYCNLKRASLLDYLPEDLVGYMQHITQLNRERNEQIIKQAKEINSLLIENNITPIFLKGTGNLLEGVYDDIAERMVGDIDFLVHNEHFKESIRILKDFGYSVYDKSNPDSTIVDRHYPKMTKDNRISSIEVHYKMVSDIKFNEFNYDFIKDNLHEFNQVFFLSDKDKIILTCINKQFNDAGFQLKNFSLRNSYDLYVLSRKTSPLKSIKKIKNYAYLNYFLFSTSKLLNTSTSIDFENNKETNSFYSKQIAYLKNNNLIQNQKNRLRFIKLRRYLKLIIKSAYSKEHRKYLYLKLKSMF